MSKNIATVEPMSAGQAIRISERFQVYCRKEGVVLPFNTVQAVLDEEMDALISEIFQPLRTRVERRSEMIVRHFKLDRTKTLEQMIEALGHNKYVDAKVLATMPTDGPDEGDMIFFPLKRFVPVAEYSAELELRGLKAHPLAQLQINADDQAFTDEHPNGSQWGLDAKGQASFVSVNRWLDERHVYVNRNGVGWYDDWWGCGVRK